MRYHIQGEVGQSGKGKEGSGRKGGERGGGRGGASVQQVYEEMEAGESQGPTNEDINALDFFLRLQYVYTTV